MVDAGTLAKRLTTHLLTRLVLQEPSMGIEDPLDQSKSFPESDDTLCPMVWD